jgi:RNA polymerase sigma-70 factor (ECF subfamily)
VDAVRALRHDSLTALLHDDVRWNMPPYALWLQTHEDVERWCLGPGIGCKDSRSCP